MLITLSFYSLYEELLEFNMKGLSNYIQGWNILDCLNPIFILCVCSFDCFVAVDWNTIDEQRLFVHHTQISFGAFTLDLITYLITAIGIYPDNVVLIVQSLACFTIWLKVFEFIQLNKNFAFYVKSVIQILVKAIIFFAIYFFALIAFGCTFVYLLYFYGISSAIVSQSNV